MSYQSNRSKILQPRVKPKEGKAMTTWDGVYADDDIKDRVPITLKAAVFIASSKKLRTVFRWGFALLGIAGFVWAVR